MPSAVPPGIVTRFRAICRLIKASPAYTAATGEALGIVGPRVTPEAPGTERPVISLLATGGHVVVRWTKEGMDAMEIQVDRGDGQWALLAIDTRPGDAGSTRWPVPPQKWQYRAIYLRDARRIGQWSQTAEIAVSG